MVLNQNAAQGLASSPAIRKRPTMKTKALTAVLIFLAATTSLARAEALNFNLSATASGFSEQATSHFSFAPITNHPAGTAAISEEITVDWISGLTGAGITGDGSPMLRFSGGSLSSSGMTGPGGTIQASLMPSEWETTYTATVSIGTETADFSVTTGIQPVSISLNSSDAFQATVNTDFSQDISSLATVEGGPKADPTTVEKLSWAIGDGSGTLPAGLSIDAETGIISGKPTATGESSFEVVGSYLDEDGRRIYTINVGGQILSITKISAGSFHTCAITNSGGAKCWGKNDNGQLGDGTTTYRNRTTPVDVLGLNSGIVSIDVGTAHTCAATSSGGAKCWGGNSSGQLGDGTTTQRLTPVDVFGMTSNIASVATGEYYTCAVTRSGGAKCWGSNGDGQLGDGTKTLNTKPVDVVGLTSGVDVIKAGGSHTCAVTTSGGAKCWGNNANGQLGDGTTTQRLTPVNVSGLTSGVASIETEGAHACAVTISGGAKCWGWNSSGQLGDGTTTQRLTPVDVVF